MCPNKRSEREAGPGFAAYKDTCYPSGEDMSQNGERERFSVTRGWRYAELAQAMDSAFSQVLVLVWNMALT